MADAAIERVHKVRTNKGEEKVGKLRAELQEVMMNNVGVFREAGKLEKGLEAVKKLQGRLEKVKIDDQGMHFNTDLTEALELHNLLAFADLIVAGALKREESRGAQWRTDFPVRDDKKLVETYNRQQKSGQGHL